MSHIEAAIDSASEARDVTVGASELFDLTGRVAVVTGASSGLGTEMAHALRRAGADVVAVARREDRLRQLARHGIVGEVCDVSDPAAVESLAQRVHDRYEAVDVLVNNAGTTHIGPAEEESIDEFRRVVDLNLLGAFQMTRCFVTRMLDKGKGSVINIASIHGLVSAAPNHQTSYAASKGGLMMMTRELAVQWARRGVRVNAIAPAYFPSELTDEFLDSDRGRAYIERKTPMRRPGRRGELDGVLLLLASDAGSYITGQTIAVDGGWTAW